MRTANEASGGRPSEELRRRTRVVSRRERGSTLPLPPAPWKLQVGDTCLWTSVGLLPAVGVPLPRERGVVRRPCLENFRASDAQSGVEPAGPWHSVFLVVVPATFSCQRGSIVPGVGLSR